MTTIYPGASAEQVEREVSDVLESAVQQLTQLKQVRTTSRPGYSELRVEILERYSSEEIPQIWDELRRKINDTAASLPPGAQAPVVNDDFGDVFGLYYAMTGDGLTRTELHEAAKTLRRGLLPVEGVGRSRSPARSRNGSSSRFRRRASPRCASRPRRSPAHWPMRKPNCTPVGCAARTCTCASRPAAPSIRCRPCARCRWGAAMRG